MNSRKLLGWVGDMSLIVLLLVGCGAPAATPSGSPAVTLPQPTDKAHPSDTPFPTSTAVAPTATLLPTNTPRPTATPSPSTETSPTPVSFDLTSSAFEAGQPIPVRHTCHGEDLSPPLAWTQAPPATESFVLIMDDPDAVKVVGFVWDHWLLFNVPADVLALSEGIPEDAELPDGSRQGQNSFHRLGYNGPCPPSGQTHTYVFTLYAVDTLLELPAGAGKDEILQALDGHILAQTQLVGSYTSP